MSRKFLLVSSLAFGLTMAGCASAPNSGGSADSGAMMAKSGQALYSEQRGAYEAALRCRGLHPSDQDRSELGALLRERAGEPMLAGVELSLIVEAQRDVARLHSGGGCSGPHITELLGVYDTQLSQIF
ncbi:hypothetical protein [Limibacillus sp. MBR-115]|jgi:hypothetical protein|uniref:hypothetical protein n=1 Tax=Limibacillus sp. MBR-115 TaxID=3156465 RepID=UPI003397B7E7